MGDVVCSNQIGSTFESAFKHHYDDVRKTHETTPKSIEQNQKQPQPALKKSPSSDVFLSMRMPDIKPVIDNTNQIIVDTVTTEPKTNKDKIKAAAIIGSAATVVGGTALFFTKGKMAKGLVNFLSKHAQNITNKIETLKSNPHLAERSALKLSLYQKLNKGIMMTRGVVFNATPLKDVLFDKIVCDYMHLRKPCNAITNWFRKLSFATVKSNYKKTNSAVENMTTLFNQTNKALESGTLHGAKSVNPETLNALNKTVGQISTEFNTHFSESAINNRNNAVSKICKNLNQRVFKKTFGNLKHFITNVKSWTTFIPESLIAKDKSKFLDSLLTKKRVLTNSPQDNFSRASEVITQLEKTINPLDKGSREVVLHLKKLAQKYVSASGQNESATRGAVLEEINQVLRKSKTAISDTNYPIEKSNAIKNQLDVIGKIFNTDKKGLIEEALTTYKEILPPAEYENLKKAAQKAIDRINKSTFQEGNEYVDKVRDLTDGSALTDVALSMVLPLASTSIAISAAKTKEKKQSVALKYGIPIVTGALTATIATVKLVAGGKSLALGLASTLITNQICDRIDKKLKQKSANK